MLGSEHSYASHRWQWPRLYEDRKRFVGSKDKLWTIYASSSLKRHNEIKERQRAKTHTCLTATRKVWRSDLACGGNARSPSISPLYCILRLGNLLRPSSERLNQGNDPVVDSSGSEPDSQCANWVHNCVKITRRQRVVHSLREKQSAATEDCYEGVTKGLRDKRAHCSITGLVNTVVVLRLLLLRLTCHWKRGPKIKEKLRENPLEEVL